MAEGGIEAQVNGSPIYNHSIRTEANTRTGKRGEGGREEDNNVSAACSRCVPNEKR